MGDILAIATLVGVIAGITQLHQLRKQRRREFENLFIQRYWGIMDTLSLDALVGVVPSDGAVCESDRRAVLHYLRLCEDELELRHEGWFSDETWRTWRAGIAQQLQRWPFGQVWRELRALGDPPGSPVQFSWLRQHDLEVLSGRNPEWDPCQLSRFSKLFRVG